MWHWEPTVPCTRPGRMCRKRPTKVGFDVAGAIRWEIRLTMKTDQRMPCSQIASDEVRHDAGADANSYEPLLRSTSQGKTPDRRPGRRIAQLRSDSEQSTLERR